MLPKLFYLMDITNVKLCSFNAMHNQLMITYRYYEYPQQTKPIPPTVFLKRRELNKRKKACKTIPLFHETILS